MTALPHYTKRHESSRAEAPGFDIVFVDDYGAMTTVLDMAAKAGPVIGQLGLLRDMAPKDEWESLMHLTVQYKEFRRACSMLAESGLSVALCVRDPVALGEVLHCVWQSKPVAKPKQEEFWS